MSHRIHITAAFILAILATFIGWSQSLIYKDTPPVPLALWFPLIVITDARDLAAIALSFVQFPLFATAFAFGIRRWPTIRVLVVLALTYALLAGVALAMVRSWSKMNHSQSSTLATHALLRPTSDARSAFNLSQNATTPSAGYGV